MVFIASKRYSEKKSFSAGSVFGNNYLRTFLVSLAMALFTVFAFYGIYGMISERTNPVNSSAIVLLIFAVLFVVGYEFFNSKFARRTTALVVGFLVAFCITVLILALIQFALMVVAGTVIPNGPENFIIAVAFCMIASVIVLKYLENI